MSATAVFSAAASAAAAPPRLAPPAPPRVPSSPRRLRALREPSAGEPALRLAAVTEPASEASEPAPAPPSPAEDKVAAYCAKHMVDVDAMIAANPFAVSPEDLIAKTKAILAANNGAEDPSLLASDFKFVAPVVGPLPKDDFLKAFASFQIEEAFPDAKFGYYAFRVDPFEPNRVWFDARFKGTNTGTLAGSLAPTGIAVDAPPQACSMRFNDKGEATQLTVGYVMDRQIGNTGGLGGVFGILYAIGYGLPSRRRSRGRRASSTTSSRKSRGSSPRSRSSSRASGGTEMERACEKENERGLIDETAKSAK